MMSQKKGIWEREKKDAGRCQRGGSGDQDPKGSLPEQLEGCGEELNQHVPTEQVPENWGRDLK